MPSDGGQSGAHNRCQLKQEEELRGLTDIMAVGRGGERERVQAAEWLQG
jgi:hypothetical protein